MMADNLAFESPDMPPQIEDATSLSNGVEARSHQIIIKRRMYTKMEIDDTYKKRPRTKSVTAWFRSTCHCSKKRVASGFLYIFPVINVIRGYRLRNYILDDILSGLSAGFVHLPQGLAFGLLSSLAAVNGLYTSFFPIIFYVLFGTSRHVSFGTNAVIAILTASIVNSEGDLFLNAANEVNSTASSDKEFLNYKVGIAMATSFTVGVILLVMGILRLGFITMYLSASFVEAFSTASAFHIGSSQINKILKIDIKTWSGPGKLVFMYIDIFTNITKTNIPDLIVALISMVVILLVKIGINERCATKMKMPVPIDLICVVVGTIISHFAELNRRFDIAIVGDIPTGLAKPTIPNMECIPRIATESFVIAIIIFSMSISITKLMAKLYDYEIDDNQELIAYGMSSLASSFFGCFPSCIAASRTMILGSLRAKTTLNGITSAVFILIVLLVAGQLFVSLPISVLGAMIIVAMKNLILQLKKLPGMWMSTKADFVIWITTFLVGVFGDLKFAIVAGVGVSILTVIIHTQMASGSVTGLSATEDIFVKGNRWGTKEVPGIKVFYFNSILFFANADKFKTEIFEKTFQPGKRVKKETDITVEVQETSKESTSGDGVVYDNKGITHIIIDCSAMTFIDIAGLNILKIVVSKYKKVDTEVYLASCGQFMWKTLKATGFFHTFPKENVFYDIWDAVIAAQQTPCENRISVVSTYL